MEELDYDDGWRHGTFAKCNGAKPDCERDESDPWACGYWDAYESNDVKVAEPVWDDDAYNLAKADYLERLWAIVGSFPRTAEQQDALVNALNDVLDEVDKD